MEDDFKTLISFGIDNQTYAFYSIKVEHILPYEGNITRVANVPIHILGVINLHGNILPVFDMRMVMDVENIENVKDTSIIIVNPDGKKEDRFGIVVDIVKEVFEVNVDQIKPPTIQQQIGLIHHFEGTLNIDEEFIHIIDLSHVQSQLDKK